jgi:hypothetical protein
MNLIDSLLLATPGVEYAEERDEAVWVCSACHRDLRKNKKP